MAKYLVSGGSGFIGTNLISFLLKNGQDILNLDIQEPKLPEHKSCFLEIDLCDITNLKVAVLKFDPEYVIHLGARTDLNGKTLEEYSSNIDGVSNLINALGKLKNLKRVVFASSMYVCKPGYSPRNFEDYNPHTVYGESKVITEKIIKENNPNYIWTIIRPTSIWGPYFGEPYNLFFKIVLSGQYFHLGKKACEKTYGFIDNFIYQLDTILKASENEIDKKTFYLGDYQPYNITIWANEIAACKKIKIPKVPYFLFQMAAFFGDFLNFIRIKFPMTSFRLKNMTTNNIFDLSEIQKLAPNLPVDRKEGTKITVKWLGLDK
jgi:nucleoside-diphosphate-sugar epimerase